VWYGEKSKISPFLLELSETWKINHPKWRYEFWDRRRIDTFIDQHFPEFIDFFKRLAGDQERQNAVSYMILFQKGGLCVKLDYECIEPIGRLLGEYGCYLSIQSECDVTSNQPLLTDALILSDKKNDFIGYILEHLTKVDSRFDFNG
jgi:mannosyltransferase OCH1-like enzyme